MKRTALRLCIAIACLLSASEARAERNLEGTWRGTLGQGGGKLRLVLTLARSGNGAYSGVIDSIDQGASIPIDKISTRADRVVLEVGRVGGTYEGVLSANDTRLSGTWKQQGVSQPLSFDKERAGAPGPKTDKPAEKPAPFGAPLEVRVPIAPTAFRADGAQHLVYELHVTNLGSDEVTLKRVEAFDGKRSVGRRAGLDLTTSVLRPGVPDAVGWGKLRVGAGLRAVVFMWITLDGGAAVPAALEHRIVVTAGDRETSVQAARIAVRSDPVVIGPPLRGGDWLAGNGPSHSSGHRRALIPVGGRAAIAQRFAIDWVRLRPDGKTFAGDQARNKSYRAYGAEALAVADGVVVATRDGIPENVPGPTSRAVPMTLETLGGNHVVLDIGGGRHALYAHFQPRSLRVKRGDRVRRGQVLGLVGNSGNSTEPHLHFHVSDARSPLGAEGVPHVMQSFETKGDRPGAPPRAHRNELPLENDVVTFRD